ncbi:uncharacterized protein MELLADRAFT_124559 [Melampsora larici-populina 98AG31]|uniref:Secreted protein n=1 Tax=Melampsora larici-populina (strain 98AG31 / pathotype 3-4-7) TaxID=747676 RepID=F4RSQ7_MELLP|nr:uncharacterized protein MELLADRAFT_124559 [Melampsora larici-populina 98AG31]EGG04653.1 secreted protein [Melampsora larici-populina 98AG31]
MNSTASLKTLLLLALTLGVQHTIAGCNGGCSYTKHTKLSSCSRTITCLHNHNPEGCRGNIEVTTWQCTVCNDNFDMPDGCQMVHKQREKCNELTCGKHLPVNKSKLLRKPRML